MSQFPGIEDMVEGILPGTVAIKVLDLDELAQGGWIPDHHTSAGITPMDLLWASDCLGFASLWASRRLFGDDREAISVGLSSNRLYVRPAQCIVSENSSLEQCLRVSKRLPSKWFRTRRSFSETLHRLSARIEDADNAGEVLAALFEAREFQRRCWQIHFLNAFALRSLLAEAGVDEVPGDSSPYSNPVSRVDLFRQSSRVIAAMCNGSSADLLANVWGDRFIYGQPVAGRLLSSMSPVEFSDWVMGLDIGQDRGYSEWTTEEAERSSLVQIYAWWSEDHNVSIEWQAALPLRRCLDRLSEMFFPADASSVFFLTWRELTGLEETVRDVLLSRSAARRSVSEALHRVEQGEFFVSGGISGRSLSSGRHTGSALVAKDPALSNRIEGTVLIAEGITPAWDSVLRRVRACVVANGSWWSHAAIICRDLGIPCVVIPDRRMLMAVAQGRDITVDGDAGVVIFH